MKGNTDGCFPWWELEHTYLFGFACIASGDLEKEMGSSLFCRSPLENGVIFRDLSQLGGFWAQSPLPQKSSVSQKHFPGAQRLTLTTNTKAGPDCACCYGLLLRQTLLGMNHLLEFRSFFCVLFTIRI